MADIRALAWCGEKVHMPGEVRQSTCVVRSDMAHTGEVFAVRQGACQVSGDRVQAW